MLEAHARELTLKDQLLAEKNSALARMDAELSARDAKIASGYEKLFSRESADRRIEHLKLILEKMRRDAMAR